MPFLYDNFLKQHRYQTKNACTVPRHCYWTISSCAVLWKHIHIDCAGLSTRIVYDMEDRWTLSTGFFHKQLLVKVLKTFLRRTKLIFPFHLSWSMIKVHLWRTQSHIFIPYRAVHFAVRSKSTDRRFTRSFPITRVRTSPTAIGRTPGHLSSSINVQALQGADLSATFELGNASRRLFFTCYNVTRSRLHLSASKWRNVFVFWKSCSFDGLVVSFSTIIRWYKKPAGWWDSNSLRWLPAHFCFLFGHVLTKFFLFIHLITATWHFWHHILTLYCWIGGALNFFFDGFRNSYVDCSSFLKKHRKVAFKQRSIHR